MKCQTPLGSTNIVATCSAFKEAMASPIPLLLSTMTKPLSNFLTSMNLRLNYEAQGTWLKIEELWRRMAHTFDQPKQHTFWENFTFNTIEFCSSKTLVCTTLISSAKPIGQMWKATSEIQKKFAHRIGHALMDIHSYFAKVFDDYKTS